MLYINYANNKRSLKRTSRKVELLQYAESMLIDVQINERTNPRSRSKKYSAVLKNGEVKTRGILGFAGGDGGTINAALRNLAKTVSCKTIVFNAGSDGRREFIVPSLFYKFKKEYSY